MPDTDPSEHTFVLGKDFMFFVTMGRYSPLRLNKKRKFFDVQLKQYFKGYKDKRRVTKLIMEPCTIEHINNDLR